MENPAEIIKLVWPLIVIQLLVQIYAIYDIVKRKGTKNLSPAAWIVIVILGQITGSIIYLILGRKEE